MLNEVLSRSFVVEEALGNNQPTKGAAALETQMRMRARGVDNSPLLRLLLLQIKTCN